MDALQTFPLIPVVTTNSIRRQAYAVSDKTPREEDSNTKVSSKAKQPLDNQDAKMPREEDTYIKGSSKAKQPLDNQDAKTSGEEDANFKSSSKAKRPLDDQYAKELEDDDISDSDSEGITFYDEELVDSCDSYSEGQTGYFEELEDSIDSYIKPTNSFEEASRRFLALLARLNAELRTEANCPIAIAKKEKARLMQEEIKKMTPEQYKEHRLAILNEMLSVLKEPEIYRFCRCS